MSDSYLLRLWASTFRVPWVALFITFPRIAT